LHWLDRNKTLATTPKVPCRILRADDGLSCGDADSGNLLIQGDNLHALKALLPYYRGAVKCVFIDPPYNTKSAFEHYSDSLEHSKWLDMMVPRLELLRELLAEDGSIWVTIDDHEAHYLKVVMDEIFGRGNFVSTVTWQKKYAVKSDSEFFSESHDFLLVYAKNKSSFKLGRFARSENQDARYNNPGNDPRGEWTSGPLQRNEARDYAIFPIVSPTGKEHWPPKGTSWRFTKERITQLISDNRIWFGASGNNVPRLKRFLSEVSSTVPATTWWDYKDFGHNDEARREAKALATGDDVFATPKPERLLEKVLTLATQEGDLVLDSFLGSGTTAAVAHKMNRRYIGIELGEHAKTHCAVRLQKVIEGEQGGISKAVNWQGGGGFRFYTLGAELFSADGKINPEVKFTDLAAYLWFFETRTPYQGKGDSPLLGVHNNTAIYLLYNGILKDKTATGGNVLSATLLRHLPAIHDKPDVKKVVYALGCRLSAATLAAQNIHYRHIPYQVPSEEQNSRRKMPV